MMKLNLTLKQISIPMKSFLNYFASTVILLYILQIVAIHLFEYLVSHAMI